MPLKNSGPVSALRCSSLWQEAQGWAWQGLLAQWMGGHGPVEAVCAAEFHCG